ncbi:uncharacterized protein MYCGRDRAFT_34180 [Zymoseptoria tritici IPO323]|uniref:DUF985 domain-containing protein n=1 Tax=Zymoseptoria tritici (strain CBS 115943 / IPO323) TaxID=336722 RepID=F9WWJ9_ZYMTI|nr:uncharacterized protein MYCGRDRAFT_34180 [Zymoseptoria tritici IPO323]EGP92292.1 hypothetical protein MYCGRDRAFT_34180 [Zymoseptoria tritici IPO323]
MSPHSTVVPNEATLVPHFKAKEAKEDSSTIQSLIQTLSMLPHPEGGFFVETDRDSRRVPNPLATQAANNDPSLFSTSGETSSTRSASTTIHYLLTPSSPLGHFHRNRARTVHTLHKGRGRYVIIHADEDGRWNGKARVESFIVGQNVQAGERLQWIVDGGKYKCSFLLPDKEGGEDSEEGLLISETVVPGFEFCDHDFLTRERMEALVSEEQREEMGWMLRKG